MVEGPASSYFLLDRRGPQGHAQAASGRQRSEVDATGPSRIRVVTCAPVDLGQKAQCGGAGDEDAVTRGDESVTVPGDPDPELVTQLLDRPPELVRLGAGAAHVG